MSTLEQAIRDHLELQARGRDGEVAASPLEGDVAAPAGDTAVAAEPAHDDQLRRSETPVDNGGPAAAPPASTDRSVVDWDELERSLGSTSPETAPREPDALSSISAEERRARRAAARDATRRAARTRRALAVGVAMVAACTVVALLATVVLPGGGRSQRARAKSTAPGSDVYPFPASPQERRPGGADRLPAFWNDGARCSVGCRARGVVPGWPLKPFHSQHAIRSGLNEPRDNSFHHGIDIQAADGDQVYAIQPGRAHVIQATGPDSRVQVGNFIYWHIRPLVREGQRIAPYGEVVGTITTGHQHLHLSEVDRPDHYLNPLRPGGRALEPWGDTAPPVLDRPQVQADGRVLLRAFDPQSFRVTTKYKTPVIAPAALAYRVFDNSGARVGALHWALRGSQNLAWTPATADALLAPTRQAKGDCFSHELICKPDFGYVLAGGLAPALTGLELPSGRYRLTAYAWDWAGNTTARDASFDVQTDADGYVSIRPA